MTDQTNLLGLDRHALEGFFGALGEPAFRATQTVKWIHQVGTRDFAAMTNLSKSLRERLLDTACITTPEVVTEQLAADGTRKWLLRLADGNAIETVFIPEPGRGTLCVSSQVGCPLDCSFCATAKQGFSRNLTAAEIVGQLWIAARALGQTKGEHHIISNVVFMGMGEPLLNFESVLSAIDLMLDDNAYGLSRRRVTVSTAGLVPGIDRLREAKPVALAVSLHAPHNSVRNELVPLNKKYPLEDLLAACRRYIEGREHDRVTFEYVMLDGVNDRESDARALIKRLEGIRSKVNLIPFNTIAGSEYRRSRPEAILRFQTMLQAAGYLTTVRKTRGDDIDAACGQLVGKVMARSLRHRAATTAEGVTA
jgi:23S rRNA (adenine2503-C2)-methyltransferase